ncbi:hypothetical protein F7725_008984 [Dissostichus mawsoni]|uniref:bis(5'-adenosyl)-triphosphatase n=1 Tax=Dissostichus mawsoni TaxID=36200 RepID=A0A7J5Z5U4_DISMA|nr:hypothetical protein F7725_008984 [Dissostichus mawsoni]
MLLKILLSVLCCVGALATENITEQLSPPQLLLVSFDGFRADYLRRFPMPNLKLLYSQGILVEQLTNVFITKTFPNHYSLVTGLYAESHGILASNMYDPVSHEHFHINNDSNPMWWNEARPLWISALDSGYKTAAMMWPGSDVTIRNRTATHFLPYNPNVTFKQRVGNVTKWMLGDEKEKGAMFAALYWEEPDRSGHIFGPDNDTAMSEVLKEVDDNIGLLISELKTTGLWGRVNILITSDHGMTQCSAQRLIQLDNCLHPDNYTLVDLSPCHEHMKAYKKPDIPDRLHYRNNDRVQPIILIADEGWTIHAPLHGRVGPQLPAGYRISSLQSVDIYPLMCKLLSVPPQPNNGTMTRARCLLAAESCWDVPLVIGLVVGVLLLLTAITVLFRFLSSRRPPGSRPFQRLQVDDDDDDDPMLEGASRSCKM